mgnify:CR=1 FL=1
MARSTHAPRGAIKGKPDPLEGRDPIENRCTATNRKGNRCGKPPIPGGTVCRMHGGAAPQVKAKALDRLMALQHPAIDTLDYLMQQRATFPSTAYAAARDVLDRTEGKAREQLDVNVSGELSIVPGRLAAARQRLSQK